MVSLWHLAPVTSLAGSRGSDNPHCSCMVSPVYIAEPVHRAEERRSLLIPPIDWHAQNWGVHYTLFAVGSQQEYPRTLCCPNPSEMLRMACFGAVRDLSEPVYSAPLTPDSSFP